MQSNVMNTKDRLNLSEFPVLETERLKLRAPRISDAADVLVFRSDPVVQKYDDPIIHTIQEAETLINELLDAYRTQEGISWAVELKDQGIVIGFF